MITELIVSAIVVTLFIGVYYWVTGTPPGARVISMLLGVPIVSMLNNLGDHSRKW